MIILVFWCFGILCEMASRVTRGIVQQSPVPGAANTATPAHENNGQLNTTTNANGMSMNMNPNSGVNASTYVSGLADATGRVRRWRREFMQVPATTSNSVGGGAGAGGGGHHQKKIQAWLPLWTSAQDTGTWTY